SMRQGCADRLPGTYDERACGSRQTREQQAKSHEGAHVFSPWTGANGTATACAGKPACVKPSGCRVEPVASAVDDGTARATCAATEDGQCKRSARTAATAARRAANRSSPHLAQASSSTRPARRANRSRGPWKGKE